MTQPHANTASTPANLHEERWFNLHIEGCGNFYNARMVNPAQGRRFKPFLSVRIALLQGPTQNPEPMFMDLKVTGSKAKKIIEMYFEHINDRDTKTFASIKFSDLGIEPNPNAKNGQQPFFMKGRLINVEFLKVGDQVIDLSVFDEPSQQTQAMAQQPPLSGQMDMDRVAQNANARPAPHAAHTSQQGAMQ